VCVRETKDFTCSSRVHRRRCTFDWPAPIYYYTRNAHPVPSPVRDNLIARRRAFIIYYSRRTVRKRQVLVCCLYNQLARYTRSYIIYCIYLPTGRLHTSIMYVEKRRDGEREGGRELERDRG